VGSRRPLSPAWERSPGNSEMTWHELPGTFLFSQSTYDWWCFVTWTFTACALRKPGIPVWRDCTSGTENELAGSSLKKPRDCEQDRRSRPRRINVNLAALNWINGPESVNKSYIAVLWHYFWLKSAVVSPEFSVRMSRFRSNFANSASYHMSDSGRYPSLECFNVI
jgi:hypothetical protein